jgi:hypothetical protein
MKTPWIIVILVLALAIPSSAQVKRSATAAAADPLRGACSGAWNEVMDAIYAFRTLDSIQTRGVQQKATCLLQAISTTTFDVRDSKWDAYLAAENVRFLVGAYGPEGYDFFAAQIPLQQGRVGAALTGVLVQHGQPEAVARYFAQRREQLARGEQATDSRAFATRYRPLLERGECSEPLCSSRMAETLRVVRENLAVVQHDLETVASLTSRAGATEQEIKDLETRRADARDLLEVVGRVRRGEASIGKIH